MSEAPELPEAKDPFEKLVAVSIAIMAVFLAIISMHGDNAKAESLRETNEKSNQWARYQAKSIKKNITQLELKLAKSLGAIELQLAKNADANELKIAQQTIRDEIKRYEHDEEEIKVKAETHASDADRLSKVNDRCDYGALGLQIGIVIASVAILSHFKPLWLMGLGLGAVGTVVGATAFFM